MLTVFNPKKHIQNIYEGSLVDLLHSDGSVLPGIRGVAGAGAVSGPNMNIGADRIIMQPGSAFELHTHPGAHILYILQSRGFIHIDGEDYEMRAGDTVYVPAHYPHGVRTNKKVDEPLELLAFGAPHTPIDSQSRMTVVADTINVLSSTAAASHR